MGIVAFRVIVVLFATLTSVTYSCNGVKVNKLSEEDQKMDIKKNSTIVIKTVYGDIYDCVNILKQPAFSHPALKGHKIQMKPYKMVEEKLAQNPPRNATSKFRLENIWLNKKGCPQGTVPIRRMTPKKMRKARYSSKKLQLRHQLNWQHGLEFAGIYINPGRKLQGASAIVNIYNPKNVGPHQFSSATVSVESGQGDNLNQIQMGWMVNPELYGDDRTRLYTSWTANNHRSTGCYNTLCPGFVMVNTQIPLDYVFLETSVIEGKQIDVPLIVGQDQNSGDWWFSMDLTFNDPAYHIGYWPALLFNSLIDGADTLKWGGQVFTQPFDDVSPPMGSGGAFKNANYGATCYMRQLHIQDKSSFEEAFLDFHGVDSRCYFEGDHSDKNDGWRDYSFVFGGKGGKDHSMTCEY